MQKLLRSLGLAGLVAAAIVMPLNAHAPSGAIFTTLSDGSEVNFNQYPSKEAVYLDGGPGPGAPATAAGLDDGTYVFQVTNPSGKVLLSTDPAKCRRFNVVGGLITGVVAAGGCEHATGTDLDHNATTVQLFPYNDTPNPGGVYKVWAVRVEDFLAGCAALGVSNGLNVVNCGYNAGNFHGFVPAHSKTDNFKVREGVNREIDTRFFDNRTGDLLDGRRVAWTDPLGASNVKWSYLNQALNIIHIAHVEAVENGVHRIMIADQLGCKVERIEQANSADLFGPQTLDVQIRQGDKETTVLIEVFCTVTP